MILEQQHGLKIILEDEQEVSVFSALVYKLKNQPQRVGFIKGDLTEDQEELIDQFYELFVYDE